jgi:hypothetical protein
MVRGGRGRPLSPIPADDEAALGTAWRIHGVLTDWTGKVDAKASFCLAIESAALVTVINLTAENRLFHGLRNGLQVWTFRVGVALLIAAVLCAANVVAPRLRWLATRKEWPNNFVYFGHLRHWSPLALEDKLKTALMLPILSAQLVNMSRIAWRKHVMVQVSLNLGLLGVAFLGWCTYLVS